MPYLTPSTVNGSCGLSLQVDGSQEFLSIIEGALLELTYPENWEAYGVASVEECVDKAMQIIIAMQIICQEVELPAYDSGWFAVQYGTTYTKAHLLAAPPTRVEVWHSTDSNGNSEWIPMKHGANYPPGGTAHANEESYSVDSQNIYLVTTNEIYFGYTVSHPRRTVYGGFARIIAWE